MRKGIVFNKLNSILLLLLLVFCSCGVSFGMKNEILKENNEENKEENKVGIKLLVSYGPGIITGIGGYDNTWKPVLNSRKFYWYRSNPRLAYGLNWYLPWKIPYTGWEVNLHIFGVNFLAIVETLLLFGIAYGILYIESMIDNEEFSIKWDRFYGTKNENPAVSALFICGTFLFNTIQLCDFEIKVCEYWSISLNLLAIPFVISIINTFNKHKNTS